MKDDEGLPLIIVEVSVVGVVLLVYALGCVDFDAPVLDHDDTGIDTLDFGYELLLTDRPGLDDQKKLCPSCSYGKARAEQYETITSGYVGLHMIQVPIFVLIQKVEASKPSQADIEKDLAARSCGWARGDCQRDGRNEFTDKIQELKTTVIRMAGLGEVLKSAQTGYLRGHGATDVAKT